MIHATLLNGVCPTCGIHVTYKSRADGMYLHCGECKYEISYKNLEALEAKIGKERQEIVQDAFDEYYARVGVVETLRVR